jgi:hypothetical protein
MSSSFLPQILQWNASYINGNPLKDYIIDLPSAFDDAGMWSTVFKCHLLEEMRSTISRDMTAMDFSLSSVINLKSKGRFDGEIHKIGGTVCNLNRSGNCHSYVGMIVKNGVNFFNTFPVNSESFIVKLTVPKDFPSEFYVGSDVHVEFSFGSGHLQDTFLKNEGTDFSLCIFTVMTIPCERGWNAMQNVTLISSGLTQEILNYGISKSLLPPNLSTNEEFDMSSLSCASRSLLSERNHSQQTAVMKVHSAGLAGNPHIQIIHGPPGYINIYIYVFMYIDTYVYK